MSAASPYAELDELAPEARVRLALALLEGDFRDLTLRTLAAWQASGLTRTELFQPVAGLQRPSWGSLNGLLRALRRARRELLQVGDPAQRQRLERQPDLGRLLSLWGEDLPAGLREELEPLGARLRAKTSRLRLGGVLELPIGLRNRIEHDGPTDPKWWASVAAELEPLLAFQAARDLRGELSQGRWPAPWFLEHDQRRWTFAGLTPKTRRVLYVCEGELREEEGAWSAALGALGALLGEERAGEEDLRALLARLRPEALRGVRLGDYLVGRPVGDGGAATVHAGYHLPTHRRVAVKILHDGAGEEARARFRAEASYLARFDDPRIVAVVGAGQDEPWAAPRGDDLSSEEWFQPFSKSARRKDFIALEWIEGETLEQVFRSEPAREPRELARWFRDAAGALSIVHEVGLVHRDVKPGNLMLRGDGSAVLMDFGVAQEQAGERVDAALGTPRYMAPEQLRAQLDAGEVGPSCDLYGLGATFYELFTGQRLYGRELQPEQVREAKRRGDPVRSPRRVVPSLPWEVEVLLLGTLEAEPRDRYPSAAVLEADLERFLRDEPLAFRRPSLPRRLQLSYRRNRAAHLLGGLFLLLLAAGAGFYLASLGEEQAATQSASVLARQQAQAAEDSAQLAEAEGERQKRAADTAQAAATRAELGRKEAEAQAQELARRMAALYEENARQELLAQRPRVALALADAALEQRQGLPDEEARATPALAFLGSEAARRLEGERAHLVQATDAVALCHLDSGLIVGTRGGALVRWDAQGDRVWSRPRAHRGGVRAIALGGGGRLLVSAGADEGFLQVWDARDGAPLRRIDASGDESSVALLDFQLAPDGETLAIALGQTWGNDTSGAELALYDLSSGVRRRVLSTGRSLLSLAFAPDGASLWALEIDRKQLRSWSLPGGDERAELVVEGALGSYQPGPGDRLALIHTNQDRDGRLSLWAGGAPVELASSGRGRRDSLHFDPSGRYLARCGSELRLWDLSRPGAEPVVMGEGLALAWHPAGDRLATLTYGGLLQELTLDGTLLRQFRAHAGAAAGAHLSYSPAGDTLLSSDGARELRAWSTGAADVARAWEGPSGNLRHAEGSPDGSSVASVDQGGDLSLWSTETGRRLLHVTEALGEAGVLAVAPGSEWVATGSGRGYPESVCVYRVLDGELLARVELEGKIRSLAWDARGERLLIGTDEDRALLWTAAKGVEQTLFGSGFPTDDGEVGQVGFVPGGEGAWTLSHRPGTPSVRGSLRFWPLDGEGVRRAAAGQGSQLRGAVVSPRGDRVLLLCAGETAELWKLGPAGVEREVILSGHKGPVRAARFSPQGGVVVTASDDGTARVWQLAEAGASSVEIVGAGAGAPQIDFGPHGDLLLIDGGVYGLRGRLLGRVTTEQVVAQGFTPGGDAFYVPAEGPGRTVRFPDSSASGGALSRLALDMPGELIQGAFVTFSTTASVASDAARVPPPNDRPLAARALAPGQHGLPTGPADAWFELDVSAGERARLSFVPAPQTYQDAQVFDEAGAALASVSEGEAWIWRARRARRFLVRLPGGRGDGEHTLNWVREADTLADHFEPNEVAQQAAELAPVTSAALVLQGGVDWYRLELAEGEALSVRAEVGQAAEPPRLRLWDETAETCLRDQRAHLECAPGPGAYLLEVVGDEGLDYRLSLARRPYAPADRFEPNDSFDVARPLAEGRHDELVLYDADWYRVEVPAGRHALLRLECEDSEPSASVWRGRVLQTLLFEGNATVAWVSGPTTLTFVVEGEGGEPYGLDLALLGADDLERLLDFGRAALQGDNLYAAEFYAGWASELAPDAAATFAFAGRLQAAQGNTAEAKRSVEAALQRDPQNVSALCTRAGIALQEQRPDAAEADARAAVEAAPQSPRARFALAWTLASGGQMEPALAEIDHLVELDPRHARAFHLRALIHQEQQDYRASLDDASEALRLDPNLFGAYLAHAQAALQLGALELAKADLELYLLGAPQASNVVQVRRLLEQIKAELESREKR